MARGASKTTAIIAGGCVRRPSAFGYEQWLIEAHPESWRRFLMSVKSFYVDSTVGFTARKDTRHGTDFWYGYKRSGGKLHKVYIGDSSVITVKRLHEAAIELRDKIEAAEKV